MARPSDKDVGGLNPFYKWILGLAGALVVAYMSWLGRTVSSLQTAVQLYEQIVPRPVEQSLRELRDKTNGQADNCNKAQGIVSNNTTEISNLKERVTRLENRP